MRRPVILLVVTLLATAVVVAAGIALLSRSGGDDGKAAGGRKPAAAPFSTTPLSAFDTSSVSVRREAFCDRIDPRQVTAVLAGDATSQRSWVDGDRTRLGGGPTDVSHEYGCEFTGADGAIARAWVFAPPVRAGTATRLARSTAAQGTCTATDASFGSPSGLLTCQRGAQRSVTYRGLFGDAWLSCEVDLSRATPEAEVTDRAGRWCVGVAQAAGSPGSAASPSSSPSGTSTSSSSSG